MKLGFIGQGWIGRNYADHFEDRGFHVVRYSLEPEHIGNREHIGECGIVFIAVPTPTTPRGFDGSRVVSTIGLCRPGATVVIKSTVPPGFTDEAQQLNPEHIVLHAPEFLREAHARHDVDFPLRNIIGIPQKGTERMHRLGLPRAYELMEISPEARYASYMAARAAEMVKYSHNALGYATVVFANILHDLARAHGVDWATVREALIKNSWFPECYLDPVHNGGRGAGGDCFIKDFAVLASMYVDLMPDDEEGMSLLGAFIAKNNRLLNDSAKDIHILESVYGPLQGLTETVSTK